MSYQPRLIIGKVSGTGYPIDDRMLYFSSWDYDKHESWHLSGWEKEDDEAVMVTMYLSEIEEGLCLYDTLEDFTEAWKCGKYDPQGSFCLDLDKVEIIEVKRKERKED